MPDTARTRTGLQASLGADDLRTVDNTMRTAFDLLELIIALDSQGTLASRPSASKRGQYYWATDGGPLGTGWLYRDTGSAWKACSPETVVTAMIANAAATADKLADAARLGLTDSSATRRGSATVTASQSTSSASPTNLATVGPTVTVDVPANGMVAIFAQADIVAGVKDGAVNIYETSDRGEIMRATGTATAYTAPGGGTVYKYNAGMLVFPESAGSKSYSLIYSAPLGGTVSFANRKLTVIAFSAT